MVYNFLNQDLEEAYFWIWNLPLETTHHLSGWALMDFLEYELDWSTEFAAKFSGCDLKGLYEADAMTDIGDEDEETTEDAIEPDSGGED